MVVHELSRSECREVLKRIDLGRIACARAGQPYVVPIHFSYDEDEDCLYAVSVVGQKIDWMRDNPKVCVEVEHISDKDHWTTVVAYGRYQEIDDTPANRSARMRAHELLQARTEWWLPAAAKPTSTEHHQMVIYRIQIDRATGRRASRDRA